MLLKGSCHCGAVKFQVGCPQPYPYNYCFCSVCRKTAGGGGYAINLGGKFDTLCVEGQEHTSVYHAVIDTELPVPPERTLLMLDSKPSWVEIKARANDKCFQEYPDESLAEWHERLNLTR